MVDGSDITRLADAIMVRVTDDMLEPFPWGKQIPWDVGSFAGLHDYCDANMYVLDVMHDEFPAPDSDETLFTDAETAAANAVMAEVDARLAAMAQDPQQAIGCTCTHGMHDLAPARGCFRTGCACSGFFQQDVMYGG